MRADKLISLLQMLPPDTDILIRSSAGFPISSGVLYKDFRGRLVITDHYQAQEQNTIIEETKCS